MSVSAFEHPVLGGLFGDDAIAELFSFENEIEQIVQFEVALAHALVDVKIISNDVCDELSQKLSQFRPNANNLRARVRQDGVIVPAILQQMRQDLTPSTSQWLHYGATSQDVIDTVQMSRLYSCLSVIEQRIAKTLSLLGELEVRFGQKSVTAHTRMQVAMPQSGSQKLMQWRQVLSEIGNRIASMTALKAPLAFGGPVGDLRLFGDKAPAVRAALAERLNMRDIPSWHTDRMPVIDVSNLMASVTNAYGKIGLDCVLMAQNEVSEIKFRSGGASSAMPHKQNPIQAETIVSLARFSAVMASGLNASAVHEFERSGISWSQEWLLLPQLCTAIAAMTSLSNEMLAGVEAFGQ